MDPTMFFRVYIALVLIGTVLAISMVVYAERRRQRQERLECLVKSLPALPGVVCAVCEMVRANPRFAAYLPDPVPAVLVEAAQSLCPHCAIERSWINERCRVDIEAAVNQRIAALQSEEVAIHG